MNRGFWKAAIVLAVATAAASATAPAQAETCSLSPVTARGEPAPYQWMARLKARANWRRKVRETTALGPDWATWSRASNSEERCLSGPSGTVCIFTGVPCKG